MEGITASIALAYRLGDHRSDQARSILIDASTREGLPAVIVWDRALRGFVLVMLALHDELVDVGFEAKDRVGPRPTRGRSRCSPAEPSQATGYGWS